MTAFGSLGGVAARDDDGWIARELAALREQIASVASGRSLESATVSGGQLKVTDEAELVVVDATTGVVVLRMGRMFLDDASFGYGLTLTRSDGKVVLQNDGRFFGIRDKSGRIIVSDDSLTGHGLATPHIDSGGLYDTNTANWLRTNLTTFTAIGQKYMEFQNPRLTWQIGLFSDAGVTSQYRLMVAGLQVGTTQTVTGGTFSTWSSDSDLPAGIEVGQVQPVWLEAKVSATTGFARAQCWRFSGQQST